MCWSQNTALQPSAQAAPMRNPRPLPCCTTPTWRPPTSLKSRWKSQAICAFTPTKTTLLKHFDLQVHTMSAANMTPGETVSELDRHIVGQHRAKRSVAVALRNRWRRQQVAEPLRHEIVPKNILMIGPTGVGKTEVAR